eukprot:TRINITY_DN1454_c0_g2_i1.p1 TRINITY_DN1454_c0_g2~~TRINITY_DN1454_c0_g2_i1.p1  ORF type:complete len:234 (-),score=43.06 TRINITY_DN1454_c0_g2_i1:43-714(-)
MAGTLRAAALLSTVSAVTTAAALLSWKPLLGAVSALALSAMGLAIDGSMYRRGETRFWPKLMDSLLALLWATLLVLLLVSRCDWLRVHAGLVILLGLCFISLASILLRRPWVFQVAVDHVGADMWSPVGPTTPRQRAFKRACAAITGYWALLFAAMAAGVAANIMLNTAIAEDGSLIHSNRYMNLILGSLWTVAITILGMCTSEKLGRALTMRFIVRYERQTA